MSDDQCPFHGWWYTNNPGRCPYCGERNMLDILKYNSDQRDHQYEEYMDSQIPSTRKDSPVFSGVLQYFPDAMMEIARHSKKGNDKHNPGQPLHWSKDKSPDHADCVARHLIDVGPTWDALDDETGSYHATALAWRALALLQIMLERKKNK